MARPIWSGTLSFGLLNLPIQLMAGEHPSALVLHLLDRRDHKPVHYERVNSETGEEVPWEEVVKAYEYDKGQYVVLDEEDIRAAAPEHHEAIEIETFVGVAAISPVYYEKPYVLVPGKNAEKAYVLLRETLAATGKAGIARVVIRACEYLAAVMAQHEALVLLLLRYPHELVDPDEFDIPARSAADYRVTTQELEMARQLIESMAGEWKPEQYRDEFRERLHKVIAQRLRQHGVVAAPEPASHLPENAATNVVDFMALLQRSIDSRQRTPANKARKARANAAAKKAPARPAPTNPRKSA